MSRFRGGHFFQIKLTFHEMYPFRVYNSVFFVFSISTKLYNHQHYLISKPPRNPISITPQPLATTNIFSVSTDLAILDVSYKWNYTIYSCL